MSTLLHHVSFGTNIVSSHIGLGLTLGQSKSSHFFGKYKLIIPIKIEIQSPNYLLRIG